MERAVVGKVTYLCDHPREYTDAKEFIACVREELPYRSTTGFQFEVLTDDPVTRKAIDDLIYDLYGEENQHTLEDYKSGPEQGMQFGGM